MIDKSELSSKFLYLGFNVIRDNTFIDTQIPNVKRLFKGFGTHAYTLHRDMYNTLIEEIESCYCEIDVCYTNLQKKYEIYGLYPSLVRQRASLSDIMNKDVNYENFSLIDES